MLEAMPADLGAEIATELQIPTIGIGAGQVLRRETWLLRFWSHPTLTLAFLARKAAREGMNVVLADVEAPALLDAEADVRSLG